MEEEFIYWKHPTPVGIIVEEISGMDNKNGKLWLEMALQIYCEHGHEAYREIGHFPNGAPFLQGVPQRISITHTNHFLAVASLPKTPDVNLIEFSPRTAMGIDAEKIDRNQVIKVRSKFLSDEELTLINEEDVRENIIAWTAKEALYKAAMTEGLDFRKNILLKKLPELCPSSNLSQKEACNLGSSLLLLPSLSGEGLNEVEMALYSYESEGNCVTIAFSKKCAKFSSH